MSSVSAHALIEDPALGNVEKLEFPVAVPAPPVQGPYYWAPGIGFLSYQQYANLLVEQAARFASEGNETESHRLLGRASEILAGEEDALCPKKS